MIDYIESYPVKERPLACPKLDPLQSLDDIWQEVTADTKHTVVVFEEETSFLGKQVCAFLGSTEATRLSMIGGLLHDGIKSHCKQLVQNQCSHSFAMNPMYLCCEQSF